MVLLTDLFHLFGNTINLVLGSKQKKTNNNNIQYTYVLIHTFDSNDINTYIIFVHSCKFAALRVLVFVCNFVCCASNSSNPTVVPIGIRPGASVTLSVTWSVFVVCAVQCSAVQCSAVQCTINSGDSHSRHLV